MGSGAAPVLGETPGPVKGSHSWGGRIRPYKYPYMKYIKEHREWGEDQELVDFLRFCQQQLGYETEPNLSVSDDHRAAVELKSMGYFNPSTNEIWVLRGDRLRADWYRTLAHELVHHAQREAGQHLDGSDGSPTENEANSLAGKILREWGRQNPGIFN